MEGWQDSEGVRGARLYTRKRIYRLALPPQLSLEMNRPFVSPIVFSPLVTDHPSPCLDAGDWRYGVAGAEPGGWISHAGGIAPHLGPASSVSFHIVAEIRPRSDAKIVSPWAEPWKFGRNTGLEF